MFGTIYSIRLAFPNSEIQIFLQCLKLEFGDMQHELRPSAAQAAAAPVGAECQRVFMS